MLSLDSKGWTDNRKQVRQMQQKSPAGLQWDVANHDYHRNP